jgi:membrane fusion protein (multidrug efflux system)
MKGTMSPSLRMPGLHKFAVGLLACTLTTSCSRHDAQVATATTVVPPLEVQVTHPTATAITRSIILPAQVLAERQVTLYAKVSGYLQSLAVDKGDKVTAGMQLARVEMPELMSAHAKQAAELKAAQADFARMQDSLQKAPDLVVPQMVDEARGKFEIAQANLQQSETMLRYAAIAAPFAGVITQRFVDPGALLQAGTSIVTLMDFSKVRLQIAVPELEASRVAVGQPVLVTTENLPGKQFQGQVARFTYALDTASRTMLAEVNLDNPELALRPGMLVTAKLGIEHKENATVIPVEALVMEKANAFAYTVEAERATKHPLRIGFKDDRNVEVLEGLEATNAVILVGKLTLANAMPVHVVERK